MKTSKLLLGLSLSTMLMVSSCKKTKTEEPAVQQTNVSGNVEGTWNNTKIYTVSGTITVAEGKALTIEEGTTIIFDPATHPEFIVKGNLYCKGTEQNPVKLTVPDSSKTEANKFGKLWGGIFGTNTCAEMLIEHTIIEYGGATTTEESVSVKDGLYKAVSGENVPVLNYANVNGKLVFRNNTVRNFQEDGLYLEGGQMIIANNVFYTTGLTGGHAINIKSGVLADVAYNLIYGVNTNGLKLSNSGDRTPQAYVKAYNNTIVNAGWRRPDVKGGSIWLEKNVRVDLANNLLANCRFGVKRDTKNKEDVRSTINNGHYYGYTQTGVDQFQPSADIVKDTNAIISNVVGANDPMFVNYPVNTDGNNATFNTAWDFHLQAGAPGLNKGKTSLSLHFASGLVLNGTTYSSPAIGTYIGAYSTK